MRDSIFGRGESRGSVPRVPQGSGHDDGRGDPWGRDRDGHPVQMPPGYPQQQAAYQPSYQGAAPMQPAGGGGGSFLGTAAATAAGVIGGSLLMNGIRSAMAGHQGGPASKAFEGLGGGGDRPWGGSAANSDLAREAGLDDIAGGRGGGGGGAQRAGLFDNAQNDDDADYDNSGDDGDDDDGGFDGGDSDTA